MYSDSGVRVLWKLVRPLYEAIGASTKNEAVVGPSLPDSEARFSENKKKANVAIYEPKPSPRTYGRISVPNRGAYETEGQGERT